MFDGKKIDEIKGETDLNFELTVTLTDPNGLGVKTTIIVFVDGVDKETSITFTVITSPDTDKANIWAIWLTRKKALKPTIKRELPSYLTTQYTPGIR